MKVEARLSRNLDRLKKALRLDQNDDMVVRRFVALGQSCALIYIDGMSGGDAMAQHVMRPLLASTESLSGAQARALALEKLIEITELKTTDNLEELVLCVMNGQSALLMDSVDRAVLMDTRSYVRRSVSKPVNESVVIGPHEAFNESLRDNLTLLHRMLRSPRLLTKTLWVGTEISTQVSLCWLEGACPQETLDELEKRVGAAAVDCVMSGGMLMQLIEDNPWSPFPQVMLTERPDRAVSFLLEGQALLLRDGSPFALAAPVGLWHFFHAPDDSGMRWQYGSFSRIVRLFGASCALLLPAVFLALVLFSPGAMPMTLLTSVIESRATVPVGLFGESVLMLLMFNLINEAGQRVPGVMGSSLGLVSALILGSAAVDAALVSPLLIIVIALGGLGSYALPGYPMSFVFRILQLVLLLVAGLAGLPGLLGAFMLLTCMAAGATSLGRPYLAPTSPSRAHNPDIALRAPIFHQRLRAYLADPSEMRRSRGRMRRFGKEKKP